MPFTVTGRPPSMDAAAARVQFENAQFQAGRSVLMETTRAGPPHAPEFCVRLHVGGDQWVVGYGTTRTAAELQCFATAVASGTWRAQADEDDEVVVYRPNGAF